MKTHFGSLRVVTLISCSVASFVASCSQTESGIQVRKGKADRPDLTAQMVAQGTLAIPASTAFNLTSFRSEQDQDARGESVAVGKDGARCRATARNGGSAWGEFLLGYDFDNTTSADLDAVVKIRLQYADSIEISRADPASDAPAASATTTLVFEIKDSNGVVVRRETLAGTSGAKGPRSQKGTREAVFDARFQNGLGYYLAVFGRCQAHAAASNSALEVSLEISQCTLEISWQSGGMDRADAGPPVDAGS